VKAAVMSDLSPQTCLHPVSVVEAQRLSELSVQTFCDTFGYLYNEADLQGHLSTKRSTAAYAELIAKQRDKFFFVTYQGEALGYLSFGANSLPYDKAPAGSMELKQFYLLKQAQGQGLGNKALREALALPELSQAPAVYLGVWQHNHGAQRLYARYGFRIVGNYYYSVGSQKDPEFIMERKQNSI
jgi:ribosomal protein S18 acetylase RimI-like enzyme